MTEIFQKYKNIGLEIHKKNIQKISTPLIIIGEQNVGKKELIKHSLKSVIYCNVNNIQKYTNGFFYNTICITNVDLLKESEQNMLCSYIDKYQIYVRFIFTARRTTIINSLNSRTSFYKLNSPSCEEIVENITPILKSENILLDINTCFGKTYHLILVELTLINYDKSTDILYTDRKQCSQIIDNIHTLPYHEIRKQLYDLFLKQISMHEIIKYMVQHFLTIYKNNIQLCSFVTSKAAHYEHQMCLGNKDIYHLEAFVFGLKNRMLCNIK
jgi:DNA polymerase III delta prime subunit